MLADGLVLGFRIDMAMFLIKFFILGLSDSVNIVSISKVLVQ